MGRMWSMTCEQLQLMFTIKRRFSRKKPPPGVLFSLFSAGFRTGPFSCLGRRCFSQTIALNHAFLPNVSLSEQDRVTLTSDI